MDKGDLKKALQDTQDRDVAEIVGRISKLALLERLTAPSDEDIEAHRQMSDAEVAVALREMGVDTEAAWQRFQDFVTQRKGDAEPITREGPDPLP